MMQIRGISVIGLAVLAFGMIGCNDKMKADNAQLVQDNTRLNEQNKDLQNQIQTAKGREAGMMSQLDAAHLEANAARLAAEAAKRPAADTTARQGGGATVTNGEWVETDRTAKATVGTDVLFASGNATLTAAGKKKVDQLAATVKSRYSGMKMLVYGYTDADPIRRTKTLWQDNLDLSANRAMAVTRELIAQGVPAKNVETIAMGEQNPIASNTAASGKAKNRRVELVVLKK